MTKIRAHIVVEFEDHGSAKAWNQAAHISVNGVAATLGAMLQRRTHNREIIRMEFHDSTLDEFAKEAVARYGTEMLLQGCKHIRDRAHVESMGPVSLLDCKNAYLRACAEARTRGETSAGKTVREYITEDDNRWPKAPTQIGEREFADHQLPLVVVYNGLSRVSVIRCISLKGDGQGCTGEFFSIHQLEEAIDHALDDHKG